MKVKALIAAFPHTIPIAISFLLLGISYGFLMQSNGFSFWYPMLMSLFIFAGSMEFLAISLLLSTFNPLYAFCLTLMVNARHIFYGISMLDKYKNIGLKKYYLIFGMCDESFAINCTITPPIGIDKGWFMFFITLLNHIYWVTGSTLGALLGYIIHFDTTGMEFIMTALFIVMFINQWNNTTNHKISLIGIISSVICLYLFGDNYFILPTMVLIIICVTIISISNKYEVIK